MIFIAIYFFVGLCLSISLTGKFNRFKKNAKSIELFLFFLILFFLWPIVLGIIFFNTIFKC